MAKNNKDSFDSKRTSDKTGALSTPSFGKKDAITGSIAPSSMRVFNESPNSTDDRLGFINRDAMVTERLRTPMVINPMGRDVTTEAGKLATPQPTDAAHPSPTTVAIWDPNAHIGVPGIMALDLEYTPLTSSSVMNITSDIFLSKWIDIRQLDNMVKNWQPGDLCIIELGLMIVRAQMAHIRRAIEVMRDVYQDSKNLFYSPTALLASMGFYMNEDAIRFNYERYWRYYNQTLVGTLNNVKWMSQIPGHNRWASLFRDVYKDNPAKTNYTQMFLLRPKRTYYLTTEEDGWHLKPLRTNDEYWTMDSASTVTEPGEGGFGFMAYMQDTYALIRALFYDDSTQDMLATLNAIAIRGRTGGNIGDVEELHFDRLEFSSENSTFTLTFDMQMLVALQNATIMDGLRVGEITVDPKTGNVHQIVSANENSGTPAAIYLSRIPKIINMPVYTPTQDDMINATQWTVVAANDANHINFADDKIGFGTGTFGTDVIVGMHARERQFSTDGAHTPGNAAAWTGRIMHSYVMATPGQANALDVCRVLMDYMNFAFAPMPYVLYEHGTEIKCYGPLVQAEVYFVADDTTLPEIHNQWHRNFWGYPSHLEGTGQPTFDVRGITEIDPVS